MRLSEPMRKMLVDMSGRPFIYAWRHTRCARTARALERRGLVILCDEGRYEDKVKPTTAGVVEIVRLAGFYCPDISRRQDALRDAKYKRKRKAEQRAYARHMLSHKQILAEYLSAKKWMKAH